MRLWSIHPSLLDTKGFSALWRESILAQNAILNKMGYSNHPQLIRFKNSSDVNNCMRLYMLSIFSESIDRGYAFDYNKTVLGDKNILERDTLPSIPVTIGQVLYEKKLFLAKLKYRKRPMREKKIIELEDKMNDHVLLNPVFTLVPGRIESWERIIKSLQYDNIL